MARYRKIDPRIWNDEKFSSLSHEAQRIFLFVLTHPSMTGLGAFRISRNGMAEELGLDLEGFGIPFAELLRKGLLKYDERAFLLFAPNFIKYNAPENPNVVKGWAGSVDLLPECPLMLDVLLTAKACTSSNDGLSKAFANTLERVTQTLSERYGEPYTEPSRKGMPNQEQEQEYISTDVDIKEKYKKEKSNDSSLDVVQKRGSSFCMDSLPDEWETVADEIATDVDPKKAFDDFADYWRGVPGEKGRKKDWLATWRNYLRNIPDWKRKNLLKARASSGVGCYREPWEEPGYYGDPTREKL